MAIEYRDTREFAAADLQDLFLSVAWDSGNHPKELAAALAAADSVVSAWDGGKLVGLINGLSDGVMCAYFHYLLVRPEYQGQGIGRELVRRMLERYADCATKVLIAYNEQVGFYEGCGFRAGRESTPMFLSAVDLLAGEGRIDMRP